MARIFMKNWTPEMIDAYAAKKKAKEFYDQSRPIDLAYAEKISVGVLPFLFTPVGGAAGTNKIKVTMTEQALTIVTLMGATAATNMTHDKDKMLGGTPDGLLFTPAKVVITLWDGAEATKGTSGLTGKTGIDKYKTRTGSVPFGDNETAGTSYTTVRKDLVDAIALKKDLDGNKVKGLSFKPEMVRAPRASAAKQKTSLAPANTALGYN
jgi:hypothetical protein